jgi:protocatechuate 3,4-dioxygenase beta subunit
VATPTGVTYTVTSSNASTGFFNNGVFTATAAGAYTIQAAIGSTDLTTTVNVYGQAASVSLVFPNNSATLTANGATDQVTAKVLDANGNVVSNFNGTLNVTLTHTDANYGTLVNAYGGTFSNPITITNGVGTINLQTPSHPTATTPDGLTVSNLASTNGQAVSSSLTYGSSNVTYTAASATQLKFATSTATLSNANGQSTTLKLNVADAQGVTVSSLSQTTYITLSLNGPGSFTQLATGTSTPVTSETVTANADGTYSFNVYPVVGQTGTITVSAASTGLTSASATVNLVTAGLVSTFAVNSTTGTLNSQGASATDINNASIPAGTTYTLYTVQFVDVNGNPVAAPDNDTITVTDNSQGLSGTTGILKYYSYNPTAVIPGTSTIDPFYGTTLLGTSASGTPATFNPYLSATGTSTFAVFNTSSGTTNPTITVTDSGLGISKTASYTYVVGSAAAVAATSTQANPVTLTPGGSSTVSFQLTDAAGNPVAQSGVTVNVWFDSAPTTGITLGSSQVAPTTYATGYQAATNAQGIATVTVNASSTASGSFTVEASNTSSGTPATVSGSVTSLTNAINTVGYGSVASTTFTPYSSTSIAATAGQTLGTDVSYNGTIFGLNAIGAPVSSTSDKLQLTVSDKNILAVTDGSNGWTLASSGTTATHNASTLGVSLPLIKANLAGTATIKITDISVPSQPSVTLNVTVTPGVGSTTAFVSNGAAITSSAPLTLAANTSSAINLTYVDAGGNPVAVTTTPSGITFALSDGGKGGTFSATSGGSPIYQVNIPNGQTSATVYYKNPTAGSYSGFSAAAAYVNSVANATSLTSLTTTSSAITVTGTLKDQNGNPFGGATVYVSSSNTGAAVNGVTNTSTSNQVAVTANASGVITFTYKSAATASSGDSIYISATSGGSAISTGGTLTTPSY